MPSSLSIVRLIGSCLVGLFVLVPLAVQAASPREIFEKHGLLGTFAPDCKLPPSQTHSYIVHRARDVERVQRDTMVGPNERSAVVIIETAAVSALNALTMNVHGHNNAQLSLTYQIEGNRFRVMQYVRSDGKQFVVDGRAVFAAQSPETPWLSKCG